MFRYFKNDVSKSGLVLLIVVVIVLDTKLYYYSSIKNPLLSANWEWKKNLSSLPNYPDAMHWILFCLKWDSIYYTPTSYFNDLIIGTPPHAIGNYIQSYWYLSESNSEVGERTIYCYDPNWSKKFEEPPGIIPSSEYCVD